MALTDGDNGNLVMPVSPMGNGGGFGFGGNDLSWLILLLLCGWGNGGFGFGGGMDGGLYPWLNNSQNINDGFREQMLNTNVTSIRDGISDISTQLCGGFAGVNAGVANGFSQAEIAANGRQMANMNQAFGMQTAMSQGFNQLGSQVAEYGCEARLANCQTQNTISSEASATRFADANNTRDIIQSQSNGTQAILDKLCQLELDGKNDRIADLERQLALANLSASQSAQNAFIAQGFSDEVDALYNRLSNCPVPTTPVYGRTPIFTCNNGGCGCGM